MATGPVGSGLNQFEPIDVKIQWQIGVSRQQTGFSVRRNASLENSPQEVAELVQTSFLTTFRSILPTTAAILGIDAANVITKTGWSISPASLSGTATGGDVGPGFICATAALKSEYRVRQGQGRMFLPVLLDSYTDGDRLSTSGRTALQAVINDLLGVFGPAATTSDYRLCNWHKLLPATRPTTGPQPLPEVPATYYDVASVRLNPQVTALNSRKQTVGS